MCMLVDHRACRRLHLTNRTCGSLCSRRRTVRMAGDVSFRVGGSVGPLVATHLGVWGYGDGRADQGRRGLWVGLCMWDRKARVWRSFGRRGEAEETGNYRQMHLARTRFGEVEVLLVDDPDEKPEVLFLLLGYFLRYVNLEAL